MVKKYSNFILQLESGAAVALSESAIKSLTKKSEKSNISLDILEEVYIRGYSIWNESFNQTPEQFAFDRVNSFIAGGFAAELDSDLYEKVKEPTGDLKKACWKGYTAVGTKKKNGRTVPNCVPVKESEEARSKDKNNPASRFAGSNELVDIYKNDTPGQSTLNTIKRVVKEATYQGKKVPLNKRLPGDVKKSKVFVDPDGDGKAQKVNFGDKNMTIKKNIPARRKSFRARHNCDNPGPKTKARYWSCRAW
jgi:hypothetical protein